MKLKNLLISAVTGMGLAFGAQAADYNMRIHTLVKSPHPYNDMADYMKKELEERSDGRIEIRIFDSGQLGQDPSVISEMAFGSIDLMISTASNAVQQIPEFSIFTMPYLFEDMETILDVIGPDTKAHDHFAQVFVDRGLGMKLLALGATGTRNMASVDKPMESLADFKNVKMRTPPSPLDSESWAALGMLPVTIDWGELYAALQTGVAEAMEGSLPGYNGSKLYEVAPYLAMTGHQVQINHISVSDMSWNKLPEDLQELLATVAAEANEHGLQKALQYDSELVESLQQDHDVTVTYPDIEEIREALAPIQAKLAADLDLTPEYELLLEAQQ